MTPTFTVSGAVELPAFDGDVELPQTPRPATRAAAASPQKSLL